MRNPLGKGSFGEVILSYKDNSKEKYAAKHMIMKKVDPAYEYIKKEISVLETITKGNLCHAVKYYGHIWLQPEAPDKPDVELLIIFELCERHTLADLINKQAPFSEEDIKLLLMPVVECFAQLHDQFGMIHRDLKPENLLLKAEWILPAKPQLRLCDFGITAACKESFSKAGTRRFMAPEVHSGHPYNQSVDVFSFGVILYKMLYGFEPFNDHTVDKWYQHGLLVLPKKRRVSAECFDVLQRCLRTEPRERLPFTELLKHPFFATSDRHSLPSLFDGSDHYLHYQMQGTPLSLFQDPIHSGPPKDPLSSYNKSLFALP